MFNFLVRSGTGLEVYQHNNKTGSSVVPFQPFEGFPKDESKACKALIFSECGKFFAYGNGKEVKIMDEKFNCKISLQVSEVENINVNLNQLNERKINVVFIVLATKSNVPEVFSIFHLHCGL